MTGDETITIHPFVRETPMGDTEWGTDRDLLGCIAWPAQSAEIEAGGFITDGWNVYIPADTLDADLPSARDEISLHGTRYEVKGVPGRFRYNEDKGTLLVLARAGA